MSVAGFSASGGNVFDFFFTGTIPWFLVIGAAVITVLLVLDVLKEGQAPWPLILLAMTARRRTAAADPPDLQPARRARPKSTSGVASA